MARSWRPYAPLALDPPDHPHDPSRVLGLVLAAPDGADVVVALIVTPGAEYRLAQRPDGSWWWYARGVPRAVGNG